MKHVDLCTFKLSQISANNPSWFYENHIEYYTDFDDCKPFRSGDKLSPDYTNILRVYNLSKTCWNSIKLLQEVHEFSIILCYMCKLYHQIDFYLEFLFVEYPSSY